MARLLEQVCETEVECEMNECESKEFPVVRENQTHLGHCECVRWHEDESTLSGANATGLMSRNGPLKTVMLTNVTNQTLARANDFRGEFPLRYSWSTQGGGFHSPEFIQW